jgi:hypothetical protein
MLEGIQKRKKNRNRRNKPRRLRVEAEDQRRDAVQPDGLIIHEFEERNGSPSLRMCQGSMKQIGGDCPRSRRAISLPPMEGEGIGSGSDRS